ncbi:MAG TPA: hypothetical protein ENN17_05405 [bacterium]|nr:hypothetical protein [bacterium]
MRDIQKVYLKILRIELGDLEEDLALLIRQCDEARHAHRATERVSLSNRMVYENELLGIRDFRRLLRVFRPNRYGTLEEMIARLKSDFSGVVRSHGLAEAITICVNRKIDKVARYVTQ